MKPSYVVAIDLGATSGRMILSRFHADRLEMEEVIRFDNSIQEKSGKYYWDLSRLMSEICKGLSLLAARKLSILSIGVDTWGVDVGFLDEEGNLIDNPRAYRDPYTQGVPDEFFTHIPEKEVYRRTGIQIMNFNTLYQLYASRKEKSTAIQDARTILFMPDLISYLLTGKKICEYTILSTSQLYNPVLRKLDTDLLDVAGFSETCFPDIVMPGTIIGKLKHEILDTPFDYEIPVVAVAGHDTASAVAAVPARDSHFAYLSSGTWSLMGIEVKAPIITEQTAEMNFTNEGGVDGTTRFLKNITGMWILEQCRKEWKQQGKVYDYRQLMDLIDHADPFYCIINPDHPSFINPPDMNRAIVEYCRNHAMAVPQTDAQVVRCIMESLALRYRNVFDHLCRIAPFSLDRLHIIGGGARNEFLNQFTANALGVPVYAGPFEATSIGNVMLQFKTHGLVNDTASMRRLLAETFPLKVYEPADTESWNTAYRQYEKLFI